ncbi:MAG: hypothetical protein ABIJ21_00805 [Nanoarchaeota archaeon]
MARSQIAFEYLVIFGLVVLVLIPALLLVFQHERAFRPEYLMQEIGDEFLTAVEEVRYLPPGSWRTVTVTFPAQFRSFSVEENELIFSFVTKRGSQMLIFLPGIAIQGDESLERIGAGSARVRFEAKDGFVCVSLAENGC